MFKSEDFLTHDKSENAFSFAHFGSSSWKLNASRLQQLEWLEHSTNKD